MTVLSPVRTVGDKGPGWQVSLSCSRYQEYGSCPRVSSPSLACAPHGARILAGAAKTTQDRHVEYAQAVAKKAAAHVASAATVNPDTPNVLQAIMNLEQAKARA